MVGLLSLALLLREGAVLSPRLSDISIKHALLIDTEIRSLEPEQFMALFKLISAATAALVWTYSPPCGGALPADDVVLARICGVTPAKWRKLKPALRRFFQRDGEKIFLKRIADWVEVRSGNARPIIPATLRMMIMRRDAWTCVYCGTKEGPFDVDHIVPVSQKGDATDADNLVCACAKCNRSKGAKTPDEWLR